MDEFKQERIDAGYIYRVDALSGDTGDEYSIWLNDRDKAIEFAENVSIMLEGDASVTDIRNDSTIAEYQLGHKLED